MNKKTILIFATLFASLFAINFVNAASVTCLRTVDDYWCTEVSDIKFCDPDYDVVDNAGQCAPVCCVNVEGQCNSFLTKIECESFGGTAVGAGSCFNDNKPEYPQCVVGNCNLAGDIKFGIGKNECDVLAAKYGLDNNEYTFNVETPRAQSRMSLNRITGRITQDEYDDLQRLQDENQNLNQDVQSNQNNPSIINTDPIQGTNLGCCVVGNSCSISNPGKCFLDKGQFNAGKICGNVAQCAPVCEGETVSCSSDGSSIITRNGCNEIINNNPCSASTYCNVVNNKPQCISNDCSVGGKIIFPEIDIGNGKKIPSREDLLVTTEMLGDKRKRVDGESWCMIFGQVKGDDKDPGEHEVYFAEKSRAIAEIGDEIWKHSAGLTFYRFSCNNGKVSSSQCGGEFRDEICVTQSELDYLEQNKISEDALYCAVNLGNNIRGSDIGGIRILNIPKNNDVNFIEQATCTANMEDQIKDCKANFPKGSIYYRPETSSPSTNSQIQQSQCSLCGKGAWNVCDENECRRLDDCSAKGPGGWNVAGNCAKYALLAEAMWLTAGSLAPGSSGIGGTGAFANPGWAGFVEGINVAGNSFAIQGPLHFITNQGIRYAIYSGIGYLAYGQITGDIRDAAQGQPPDPGYIGDGKVQR